MPRWQRGLEIGLIRVAVVAPVIAVVWSLLLCHVDPDWRTRYPPPNSCSVLVSGSPTSRPNPRSRPSSHPGGWGVKDAAGDAGRRGVGSM